MKKLYIIVIAAFNVFFSYGQADTCGIDSTAIKYYHDDASMIVIRQIQSDNTNAYYDSLHLPQVLISRILRPLCVFYQSSSFERDSVINYYDIHSHCNLIKSVDIIVDTNYAWVKNYVSDSLISGNAAFDSLIAGNQFRLTHYFRSVNRGWATVKTDSVYNLLAIVSRLIKIPGVISAGQGQCMGDGNAIYFDSMPSFDRLTFRYGWMDCPSGCIYNRYWRFQVNPDCSADFDSSWGNPPPPLSNNDRIFAKDIVVKPNPASDVLAISDYGLQGNGTCIISNVLGCTIFQSEVTKPQFEMDISSLPAGIYFVGLRNEKQKWVRRFIKQ